MAEKIKVVWICHLINPQIRSHIPDNYLPKWRKILVDIIEKHFNYKHGVLSRVHNLLSSYGMSDMAVWNTNAAKYIADYDDVELHIIAPLMAIPQSGIEYIEKGIHYHFFHSQDDNPFNRLAGFVKVNLFNKVSSYSSNNRRIEKLVKKIKPDIVHLIGAECPDFAQSIIKLDKKYPVIVQLQALLRYSYKKTGNPYYKRLADSEEKVLLRANYLATPMKLFKEIIIEDLHPRGVFINTVLPLTEEVNRDSGEKQFDFVYFANNLNKAFDLAIEGFYIAQKSYPNITLDILGGSSDEEMAQYVATVRKLKLENNVIFEGKLPTHDDVLKHIRKSRFALLPLKTDYISGTIREAMANGLPVITTITEGTPKLNAHNQCVLLSPKGDGDALAANMIRLLEDNNLAEMLVDNSYKNAEGRTSNKDIIKKWHDAYLYILRHFTEGVEIPQNFLL